MEPIRTLIIDDEPLARKRIRLLLQDQPDMELIAECENGAEAIEAINRLHPDLVFLDVQMPEIDGFEVLRSVAPERRPAVIFVTAFDQYAVRAFEIHALDYLLKPFDRERFEDALVQVRDRLQSSDGGKLKRQLEELLRDFRPTSFSVSRFLVKAGGRIMFISTDEIDWVEAEGNYMRLHVADKSYLLRETMAGMERRLPAARFVRIHRSTLVNLEEVKELLPSLSGDYYVVMSGGEQLKLSRNYRAALESRLGASL